MNNKEEYFRKALNSGTIDLELFRKISYTGIPHKYRSRAYLVLLNVLGLNTSSFITTLRKRLKKYESYFVSKEQTELEKYSLNGLEYALEIKNELKEKNPSNSYSESLTNTNDSIAASHIAISHEALAYESKDTQSSIGNGFIPTNNFNSESKINNIQSLEYSDQPLNNFDQFESKRHFNPFNSLNNEGHSIKDTSFSPFIELKSKENNSFQTYAKSSFIYKTLKYNVDSKTKHQIFIDVKRINPEHRIIQEFDYSPVFHEILELSAYKRPYIGYVQGMADLIVPFSNLYCQNGSMNSSLVFYCFNNLLSQIQSNIFEMQATLLLELEEVLSTVDNELLEYLSDINLDLHMFCFRWFSCLFVREFKLECWYRIFDSMICSNINEFLVYFGSALLIWFRKKLLQKDFSENIIFIQNLRDENLSFENIEELIGSSIYIRHKFETNKKQINI